MFIKNEMIERLDHLVRRDPAGRGLIGTEQQRGPLCPGHLAGAAEGLGVAAGRVAIVTGFFIPHGEPPAAETDGPPGAVTLGRVLADLGHGVVLVTDEPCAQATRVTAAAAGLPIESVEVVPLQNSSEWCERFLQFAAADSLTHLVAIERVGPSHDPVSIKEQAREGQAPVDDFQQRVPPWPWVARLPGEHSSRIPCRIATDWTLVAGISNWGAWALSAAVAAGAGRADILQPLTVDWQRNLVEQMVADGPAVDGPTGKAVVGVDGLLIDDYLQIWQDIRETAGCPG